MTLIAAVLVLAHSGEAQAAIAFDGSSNTSATGASGITVPKPSPLTTGDVMVASISVSFSGAAPTPVAPTGWTVIRTTTQGTNLEMISYWKVATAGEPASYNFNSASGSNDYVGGIAAYKGVDSSSPVDVSKENGAASGNPIAPSVTTAASKDIILNDLALGNAQGVTTDPSTTLRWSAYTGSFTLLGGMLDFAQAAAGATGTKTETLGTPSYPWIAQTIALHVPASLTTTTTATPTFSQTLDGSDHTRTYTVPITQTVAGTVGGWNLAITSTQFTTGSRTLATTASTVTSVASTCVTTCVTPTDIITRPVAVPAAATPPAAVKFTNAAARTGDGQFTITPTIQVAIPATAYAGSYSSTLTLSSVAGP